MRRVPLQQFDVAGPARAEAEIVTDQQPAGATAQHDEIDEGIGRKGGKGPIEVLHDDAVDAESARA